MADQDRVTLSVDGQLFEGWTSVDVAKGIRNPAGSYSLEYAERASADTAPRRIRDGAACQVLIGGEPIITGYTDVRGPSFDANSRTLTVEGRDKAADLVDCSALNPPGVWRDQTIGQIAAQLLAPFGLSIAVRGPEGAPFRTFALQQGESVWDALERLGRFRGLLTVSTPNGSLEFIKPGQRRAGFELRQGDNILSGSAQVSVRDRFSRYVLKGQSAGDDETNGAAAASPKAEVTDAAIERYRPLLIVAEEQATLASLADRAAWERSVRTAAGTKVDLTVQGWRDPSGAVWAADLVVPVTAPFLDISEDLLIADVRFQLDANGGSITVLSCTPPAAYQLQPGGAE